MTEKWVREAIICKKIIESIYWKMMETSINKTGTRKVKRLVKMQTRVCGEHGIVTFLPNYKIMTDHTTDADQQTDVHESS